MESSELLNIIYKVKVYIENKEYKTIGTAFLINNTYAVTAKHVIENCNGKRFILETYDGNQTIIDCNIECGVKILEKGIDIAIIKFKREEDGLNDYLSLGNENIRLCDPYETYGYPELNNSNEWYISGKVISPEGRLSISNSTGVINEGYSLYSGVSGAPFIINKMIFGVINTENITTSITKPELMVSNFNTAISYLSSIERDNEEEKLYGFLSKYCRKKANKLKNIDPFYIMYDDEYSKIKDKRNLESKVLSVCPTFSDELLKIWQRKCLQARIELETLPSEYKKAILMAVFSPCIEYIGEKLNDSRLLNETNLIKCIEELKKETSEYVNNRKHDYDFGVENIIIFENTIFNLIDSCFLSFDSYLKESKENDKNVL